MTRLVILLQFSGSILMAIIIAASCSRPAAKDLSNVDSTFIPFDEPPIQVDVVQPIYPPAAQIAGIEGVVWVKALIDTTGKVKDAIIVRDSGKNAGFEEVTLDVALRTKWKPAMANGKPVEVWVTYKVDFNLK